MCYRCVMQATDLMWDRAREIVALRAAGPDAPAHWLDYLNATFWLGFRDHRFSMRSRLEEISKLAIERMAVASGGGVTATTPREVANYINCQWLASFAANHFNHAPWLRPTALAFDLLIDTNDPFLDLIGMPGIGNTPGEKHVELMDIGPAPKPPRTEEPPDGYCPHRY